MQFHPVWTPAKARTGRSRSLLGRRRLLIAGTALFAVSSLACGLADSQGLLVGARLAQGFGAAMMSPAALSILTTTFQDSDRHKALGVWAGISGLAGCSPSVRTLAELLHRAGAVRAMELDINTEWVSFMTYDSIRDPINPPATKLLPEFRQNGGRYFNTDERDFVAVYSR